MSVCMYVRIFEAEYLETKGGDRVYTDSWQLFHPTRHNVMMSWRHNFIDAINISKYGFANFDFIQDVHEIVYAESNGHVTDYLPRPYDVIAVK